MKLLFCFLIFVLGAFAEEKVQRIATMPDEVTLTSGRVLRRVSVVRWEKDRVVLKYAGGAEPIHFSLFRSVTLEQLRAMQMEAKRVPALPVAPAKARTLNGQVFVTTMGAGAYKFSGARVLAYPLSDWDNLKDKQDSRLPSNYSRLSFEDQRIAQANAWADALTQSQAIAEATTDADGFFELRMKAGEEIFLACMAGRLVGNVKEQHVWLVPALHGSDRIDLNSSNQWVQPE